MTRFHPVLSPRLVGFDMLTDTLDALASQAQKTFPPYNIAVLKEGKFRIEMAVAGFSPDSVSIEREGQKLRVKAEARASDDTVESYIQRGLAMRGFQREFVLAHNIEVIDAKLEDGLLSIELAREIPEAQRARTIPINGHVKAAETGAKDVDIQDQDAPEGAEEA